MLYSFGETSSSEHHLVKANFIEVDAVTFTLDEEYHKNITGGPTYEFISRLSHDDATVWHAVNFDNSVNYFQLNLSDFSLVRSAQSLDLTITNDRLRMEVSEEVV